MSAISVEGVSKRYRKGTVGYRTLREDLYTLTGRLLDFGAEKKRDADAQHMWALRDVSFEVKPGERVGIIGRNGSGKTTLLRLLAGVTRPTRGTITVWGRMGVLIEIMAGFHPELTGRENIYLNGAIMGMSRREIAAKFDEIVAFSEIEDWIDTPIKRYSSGMHVRLGFAVAAHLDPDILLIDEVLAVGDASFQEKCLGKMETAAQEGRTVVFVSHNMASVRALCKRALLLRNGCVASEGTAAQVTGGYLIDITTPASTRASFPEDTDRRIQLLDASLVDRLDDGGQEVILVRFSYVVRRASEGVLLCVEVKNASGITVFYSNDSLLQEGQKRRIGTHTVELTIPKYILSPGDYSVAFGLWQPGREPDHFPDQTLYFRRDEPASILSAHGIAWPSVIYMPAAWTYLASDARCGRSNEK